ncbi:hypothetical protein NUW58_g543 [Xylaria curta]|uniref:Uncharacterized protein n=1 Tax=Xylaria curta TaxID=42375 RepID=A0ACC1PNY7_9PEZI|nr:hypothetical protein NUW58_g543 [Xylaria curta]
MFFELCFAPREHACFLALLDETKRNSAKQWPNKPFYSLLATTLCSLASAILLSPPTTLCGQQSRELSTFRVAMVGPGSCGKSQLVRKYHEQGDYEEGSTILDSTTILIGELEVHVDDTGDWETYGGCLRDWTCNANAFIIPFGDVSVLNKIKASDLSFIEGKPTLLYATGGDEDMKAEARAFAGKLGWWFGNQDCHPFEVALQIVKYTSFLCEI